MANVEKVNSSKFSEVVIQAAWISYLKWHIPPSITLAQWALESNFGKNMPLNSNNPFGIKAVGNAPFVLAKTSEYVDGKKVYIDAKFRKYSSLIDAFDDHGKLLAQSAYYTNARTKLPNPDDFADALTGVYATDPKYGTKLKAIMKEFDLYQHNRSFRLPPLLLKPSNLA